MVVLDRIGRLAIRGRWPAVAFRRGGRSALVISRAIRTPANCTFKICNAAAVVFANGTTDSRGARAIDSD